MKVVTVNENAMTEDVVPELVKLEGLTEVNLHSPTGALFLSLYNWAVGLKDTLSILDLLVCYSSFT